MFSLHLSWIIGNLVGRGVIARINSGQSFGEIEVKKS
jgi:hypothetical protein